MTFALALAITGSLAKPTGTSPRADHDCLITFCSDNPEEQAKLAKHDMSFTLANNPSAALAWNACPDHARVSELTGGLHPPCVNGKLYGWVATTENDTCTGNQQCVWDRWANNNKGRNNCRPHICGDFLVQGSYNLPGGEWPGKGSKSAGTTSRYLKPKKSEA